MEKNFENQQIEKDQNSFPAENSSEMEVSPQVDKIQELSKAGYQFLKNDNSAQAKEMFQKILDIESNNNYALVGLGDSERKSNHFSQAITYYKTCLTYHPGNNQYSKAIEIWKQYLVHDDRNITVLTRVADAYRKTHDFKKSKELYLKVLDMENDNAYALIGLGHLHYDFKEYKDALYYWTKMLELNESAVDIRVLTSIGNCHRKLKTFENGIAYFKRALEMDSKNFYALFGLADCYRGINQQYRSIEYWNRILELDPNNKVILTRAGDAYRNTGDYKTAVEYYNKALDIAFDIYAALGLALICKGEGKYEEAADRLASLIRDDGKNYRLYIDLADCYIKLNRKQDAIRCLENFQKQGIRCPPIADMLDKLKNNKPVY